MVLANNQKQDDHRLTHTARRMLALRDDVFSEWTTRVRQVLPQTDSLRLPMLVNTLPIFYDNIAEAISPDYPRVLGADGSSLAAEHGGERARMTDYNHQALISEYQIFRWVVLNTLHRENVALSPAELLTINTSIDDGIRVAVNAFAQVHAAFRERFAAALTHDLRTPLGITAMALDMIAMSDDPVEIKALAGKARASVRRMDGMVHELLDTMTFHGGRQLSLDMSNFDIQDLIREVQADTAQRARIHSCGNSVSGWWDRAAIKRALENIVGNAIKYGDPAHAIVIRSREYYERLSLSVHNEGQPIPQDEWECIFQMYRRAGAGNESERQGWGIGLPYVRAVAESHGGSVTVESTVERGTTFMVDLPVDCRPYHGAPTLM